MINPVEVVGKKVIVQQDPRTKDGYIECDIIEMSPSKEMFKIRLEGQEARWVDADFFSDERYEIIEVLGKAKTEEF